MSGYGLPGLTVHFRAVIIIGRAADKLDDIKGDLAIPALEQQHAVTIKSHDSLARYQPDNGRVRRPAHPTLTPIQRPHDHEAVVLPQVASPL